MDFYDILKPFELDETQSFNPFTSREKDGKWETGLISIDFLNNHFGHLETAEEMKNATDSESLKLYFDWLKEKGILD